ncbi:uncharacterized protein F4822DRAFT_253409 [Hypoxylon trugodes]|uniref:uncharacterized protein n=1 Tax=Hypoxylon trugodes TaxID=326681 RepID=UPI00219F3D08|nr:uncharacterized protein F4822DRAFT_253409 [Hypoxylon trugodes]KAI1388688.1 hypothetical protein F4822DRAFT_253409 [Hypoxylon trugodes]
MSAPATSSPKTSVHAASSNSSVPEVRNAVPSTSVSAPVPAPNNAAGPSNNVGSPHFSPSFQSTRLQPSSSASASRSTTSPPTTTTAAASGAAGAQPHVTMDLNPTLPSRATQLHIDEARAALVASMSNMLDSELQSRASLLHSNAAALAKQEKDVIKGTEGLRKENDKLEKLARDTERKIKELGNVQNWAEVLERDFLVLEETMRLVREGSGSDDESCSECSRSSWSGSYSADDSRVGSRRGSVTGDDDAKRTNHLGTNGNATVNDGAKSAAYAEERTNVTVDKEVSASISEAMATSLHEPLESLSLGATATESQGSSVKGKEPATEDSGIEFDTTPETVSFGSTQPADIPLPDDFDDDLIYESPSPFPAEEQQ